MAAMDEEDPSHCDAVIFADTLGEILRRLPANHRRRSRLVCQQWRDTVHERTTPNLRSRSKTLLVLRNAAYALDENWHIKWVMDTTTLDDGRRETEVVGTCNGLICFCDDSQPGGAISLANPATGERLLLPPLPCADNFVMRGRSKGHKSYGFAHHHRTGQYKVVRIPCCFDRQLDTVQVFTLGETSWRDVVATPAVGSAGTRCLRDAGIVSVDGAVYWVADGTERIMSFDLDKECVTVVKPPPVQLQTRPGSSFHLAEVYGRLALALTDNSAKEPLEKTDVWVLESLRGEQRWRRWYSVEMCVQPQQVLMLPHFLHGKHVLTYAEGNGVVYKHEPDGTEKKKSPRYGKVQISEGNRGRLAASGARVYQTFAYLETKEPLSIYKLW